MSSCENPNNDKDVLMTRRQKFDGKTKICVKCKANPGSIVVRYAVYCKTCFLPLVQTRFRKALEPTINPTPDGPRRKALKAGGSVVLGLSGGTSSTALLDLVQKTYYALHIAEGEKPKEKLRGGTEHPRNSDTVWKGRPVVCYVEVCGAFPGETDRTEMIRNVVERYTDANFEFIPLHLEDAFDPKWWQSVGGGDLMSTAHSFGLNMKNEDLLLVDGSYNSSPVEALKRYLSSLPTKTAFYSAIQIFIRLLLLHTAASRSASHLLLGTSLTSLSVNLISGIAQGAGFAVAEEAREEWSPRLNPSLKIRVIRPLRDVGMKECAIWNWWYGSPVVGKCRSMYGGSNNAIGALTRDFIFGLETDYPATVSTIARTCAKLTPKEGSDGICILCERPAQHGIQAWKAQISIRSYHEASAAVTGSTRPPHLTEDEITNLTKHASDNGSLSSSIHSLTPQLCYACHTLLTSRSSRGTAAALAFGDESERVDLPSWTRASLDHLASHHSQIINAVATPKTKMTQSDMKKQIEEFLLPDEG